VQNHRALVFLAAFLFACSPSSGPRLPAPTTSAIVSTSSTAAPSSSIAPVEHDEQRLEFAHALSKITPQMSSDEVIAAVGKPDDIKTERDPGGIIATRTVEVWRYGTDGHLTFGTLGTVHIQADKKVQYVFGGKGRPTTDGLFTEAELRPLLRAINAVSSYQAPNDPLKLIQAVNALQPLGKAKALAAIAEYLRVSSEFDDPGRKGTFLLLRTLFEVPADPGFLPAMLVGAPTVAPPTDLRTLPRFPIVIVDDIPFTIVRGYSLAGAAEPPEMHLEWYVEKGVIRSRPLAPTEMPVATLDRMIGSPSTAFLKETRLTANDRSLILEQAAKLLDTVARPELPNVGPDDIWRRLKAAVGESRLKWDAAKSCYTKMDGTFLVPAPHVIYQRVIWRPTARGAAIQIIFERKSPKEVSLEIRVDLEKGASIKASKVRISNAGRGDVATIDVAALSAPPNSTSGSAMGRGLTLDEGQSIRVELAAGSDTQTSDVLMP
jgi:hypothetical protein